MHKVVEVLVVGLGAVGSAALFQLARRGIRVLGLDRFAPPHEHGSSHGESRITRLALGEGPQYVQFAKRSHEIWRELEAVSGQKLLHQVGGLIYGSTRERLTAHGASDFLQTTIQVARQHQIPHELLDADTLRHRFPQFKFRDDETGYFEPEAGFVRPELCIKTQLDLALSHGAEIKTGEPLLGWEETSDGVMVHTHRGDYATNQLLLCAGAWNPNFVQQLKPRASVYRQVLFWFEPDGPESLFKPDCMPVFIRVPDSGTPMFYGFPALQRNPGGIKIAGEQFEQTMSLEEFNGEVGQSEKQQMFELAAPHLRIRNNCLQAFACKYTVTPDFHFVLDRLTSHPKVWVASACSGHGFKHSAAVGEALALATIGANSPYDLGSFKLGRFES